MEDSNVRRVLRRHVALTRRIRELDPRRDTAEFVEGRLRDFTDRIKELIQLRDQDSEDISLLNQAITVSQKLLRLKSEQFLLPVPHIGTTFDEGLDEGGAGVPSPVPSDLPSLSGCGARKLSESDEINDW